MKSLPPPMAMCHNHLIIITMPHSRVLKLISRSVFLFVLILLLPWIESFVRNSNKFVPMHDENEVPSFTYLPLLFQDLLNQGLIKSGDQPHFFRDENNVGFRTTPHSFDFIIMSGCYVSEAVDRSLKAGGIVVVELNGSRIPSKAFKLLSNYKIVYIRRFGTTVVAMRKLSDESSNKNPIGSRRLLANIESHPKRTALDGLEDVMFEPPREKDRMRKINYLPDLTGDSLNRYPRRVFINMALSGNNEGRSSSSGVKWFRKNYPMRNAKFDIYNIEVVLAEESADLSQPRVSDWLWKNVKEGEYVVMKAEADAVEDMLGSGAIRLVDELFLECNHQWQKGRNNRRAYWECLALYGRVRDEGIAVHQWWE